MLGRGLDPVAWCVFVEFCSSNEEILGVEMMYPLTQAIDDGSRGSVILGIDGTGYVIGIFALVGELAT